MALCCMKRAVMWPVDLCKLLSRSIKPWPGLLQTPRLMLTYNGLFMDSGYPISAFKACISKSEPAYRSKTPLMNRRQKIILFAKHKIFSNNFKAQDIDNLKAQSNIEYTLYFTCSAQHSGYKVLCLKVRLKFVR